jgi:RimJ/RimL family protein N-acetyltransferase
MVILETERLLFRAHELNDLEAYCAMEADPEVRRYVGGAPRPRETAERRFYEEVAANANNQLSLWAMVYKPEGLYIGRAGVYPDLDQDGKEITGHAKISFFIKPDYWGRGLATEAGRAFVSYGFEELKLSRINATVQVGNDASVRVLEKLGFKLVHTENGEHRSFFHFELRPS